MSVQEKQPPPAHPWTETSDHAPLQKAAFEAFARDLPTLLSEHAGKWVAYHGAELLGIADDDLDLYELGRHRGLAPQSMLVIGIDPEADQVPIIFESDFASQAIAAANE